MGRRRTKNKNLPSRVYVHHGSYRYVPKVGKPVPLAKVGDFGGMLRRLSEVLGNDGELHTLGAVMDRYLLEITPGKAKDSRRKEPGQMAKLRAVFGHYLPGDMNQPDAYSYLTKRSTKAPTAAVREIELLRHVCTMAAKWSSEWPANPLRGIELPKTKSRKRYVTNEEYTAFWNLAPPMIQCAMDLAMLTGLRRGDILALTRDNLTNDGLLVQPSKTKGSTGNVILYEMTPALEAVIRKARENGPELRMHILCNTRGQGYLDRTFDGAWQRVMRKYEAQGHERFQFKDLRKKSASDEVDNALASKRLGHSSLEITDRVYRLKPKLVRPLK